MVGLFHERTLCAKSISLAAASDYFFILVDFRKSENQKRGFRALRSASQGSALRTRKPFEKGLSESFNWGCGAFS